MRLRLAQFISCLALLAPAAPAAAANAVDTLKDLGRVELSLPAIN